MRPDSPHPSFFHSLNALRFLLAVCCLAGLVLFIMLGVSSIGTPLTPGETITAGDLTLSLNAEGRITGLYEGDTGGANHRANGRSTPLLSLVVEESPGAPVSTGTDVHYRSQSWRYTTRTAETGETARGSYLFRFSDRIEVTVEVVQKPGYATLEVTAIANPEGKDVRLVLWGPLATDISAHVGETVGVVSDRDFAVGLVGVNARTLGGWPQQYPQTGLEAEAVGDAGQGGACRYDFAVCAALPTTFGSMLQAYTRDYSVERVFKAWSAGGNEGPLPVAPLTGEQARHGQLVGSKVALFGVARGVTAVGDESLRDAMDAAVLDRLGAIGSGEDLPHPMVSKVWGKRAEQANAPHLIFTDLSSANLDSALTLANDLGWQTVYRNTGWGVFDGGGLGVGSDFGGNDAGLRAAAQRAAQRRVGLGSHSRFGAIPGSLAARHVADLLVTHYGVLDGDLSPAATALRLKPYPGATSEELRSAFSATGGVVRIGEELIAYGSVTPAAQGVLALASLQRGHEGTVEAAHADGARAGLLGRPAGQSGYLAGPGLLQDLLAPRLVTRLNQGIRAFTFGSSAHLTRGGYGALAQNLALAQVWSGLADGEDFVLGSATALPWTWHLNTRYDWGMTGADTVTADTDYHRANQVYFRRNYLPPMLGWWRLDSANEWRRALTQAAAFDAGFAWFGSVSEAGRLGAPLRGEIRDWRNAQLAGTFDRQSRFLMQAPAAGVRLDKVQHERGIGPTWRLSDWAASGAAGGRRSNGRYLAPQLRGFPLTNLARDARVTVSGVLDSSYSGALAVDTHTGVGTVAGEPGLSGAGEWAIAGSAPDKWIELAWDSPRELRRIILFDRALPDQNVSAGALTFTHADGATSTLSVSGIAADGAPKVVDFAPKTVRQVRFTLTAVSGTAPGLAEFVALGPNPHYRDGALAAGATVTGVTAGEAARLTDGVIAAGTDAFATLAGNSAALDLGGQYYLNGLTVWHYFGDARTYHDVVFEVADNPGFTNSTIVFNNDTDNSLGLGAGTDAEYPETSAGKQVLFAPLPGRYLRLWSGGNTVNDANHLTEVEVYGTGNGATDVAAGGITSGNAAAIGLGNAIDHDPATLASVGTGAQYLQLDLGREKRVNSLLVLRDNADMRTYRGVVYRLSATADFSADVTTVFNNDNDNLHGLKLGESTDTAYQETANGRYVRFTPVTARYVRLYSAGSNYDNTNRYREVLVGTAQAGAAAPSARQAPATASKSSSGGTLARSVAKSTKAKPTEKSTTPTLSSATVTGNTLTLTYDEALDGTSVPASSAFAVKAGPSGSLAAALADTMPVAVAGRTVILTLAAAVSMTDVVQVSYTAPESGKLQDAVGNAAGNLTNQAVTNETPSADKLITAGDLALQIDSMGVVTGLREGSAAGTDHNVSAQSTTLVSLVVESASTARASTGMSAHYKPTGLTYTAGTAGDGETARGVYTFSFADNISAEVTAVEKAGYATLELTGLANPNGKDVRIVRWGPLTTDITESVGEMVGVVSDRDFAIGMLGVNAKTLGGWPREYQGLSYASVAVGGNPWGSRQRAVRQGHKAARAVITTFGTALHSFTRDFTVERVIETNRIEAARAPKRRTPALTGARADAGRLVGSKVAVFGVSRADAGSGDASFREVLAAQALDRVGVIELGEGLPHPIVGNVWAKRSKKAAAPYLILTDLSTSNLDTAAAWATDIGWGTVYRDTAWGVWTDGSFGSVRSQFGGNASGLQAGIDQAERGHVDLGTHSLFGFIPPSFAGDHPTKLMVTWEADLDANITSNATSLTVRADAGTTGGELRGGISSNDGYLRIGSEIIRYRSRSRRRNNLKLGNLQRSREGTTAAAHSAGAQVGLLKRTSYSGFNNYHAELSLYDDELIPRLVAALNRGIGDFSFDGSEWLSESKYGLLTQNLVMRKIYDDLADNEDFVHDMAMGNPYTWHLNSRYNWGETGDDIRVAHQSYRWGNQVFFKRNLMLRPRMVGWWNIDNANEWRWALGKVSAFDAWFGYFGSAGDASRYNANLRAEIRDWTNAIRAGAFDWPNRFVMQERYDYFRLDKVSYSRALGPTWKLSDWATSGNSGGGRSNSRYIAPQMRGFPLTNLAPDAKVAVSGVLDNSYGGALAVDTSTGASSETNRYLTDTNGSGEWAIASSATDKWIELSWDSARKIRRIILFDREFANQNTSAGTLTFTHADSSTTTQAVTGISSDGSPKIVDFAQKTVTKVRFTLTGTSGTAPGLGEFVVLGPSSHYQSTTLAADGTVTGVTAGQAGRVNDGAIAAGSTAFATLTDNNAVLDLGGQYNIGGLNVWHRLGGASRQYHDVIFEIADNSDFDNATIVFNTDADDSLGRGAGGDAAYAEGSAGKLVQFAPVPGRYVRLWSNGNTVDSGNHLTEVEVYGTGNGTTDVADSGVTSGNNAATNLANVIDHSLDSEMANAGDGAQYVQIDLGAVKTVNSLLVMRDDANARTYKGVVYRLSETANFSSGVTTVFHNDNDNLHDLRLGESTDGEYEETENGRYVRFAPARARYVRLYSSGSDRDDSNRYREVLVGTEEAGTARPPLPVSIAVTERIVTPTAIAQTAGDTLSGYAFAVGNLIDGVGLSETPTVDNLDSVTSGTSDSHVWVTGSQGSPHYFSNSNNPDPQFRLTLDGPHTLMALVVWGYQGSANEATDFTVEFSTDGGQSYVATETVQTSALLGAAGAAGAGRLEFDETHEANHVRLTITSNARVRGFSTVGGDRVGMSEIRFVATAEPTETASVAAANGSLVVLQNTAGTIDLSALAAGDMLTYAVATQPANGTVSLMGSVATYTPNTDSFGSDSFGYGVTDAESNSDTGTIAVTVNRPPAAQDGTLLTQLGVAAEIDVSLLASDLDDDTLSFRVGRQPDHGTALLRFQTGGNIVYTPEHGYTGADSFTYIAEDGAGGMDTGTITVTVSMPPPPPVTVTIASTATFPTKDAFTVTLTFSKSVTGLEVGEVTVTNGTASNFSGLGTTYTVTVTPAAGYAGAVTVSVAAGAATAVGLGNAAASQTFAVDTKAPALSSATVTGSTLTLTYDEALDGTSVPASSAFAVKAGPSGSLAAALADTMPVAVSGRTVILTLAAAVSMTDVVQVSYTAPESGKLQDAVGNAAGNLSARTVINNTSPPPPPPGTFGRQTEYTWNAYTSAKPFATDFNDDGRGDLGVWVSPTGNWYIRYGNGAGQFSGQTSYNWRADPVAELFAGDFNNDGDGDIGVWTHSGVANFYVRYGDGTGQFASSSQTVYSWYGIDLDGKAVAADFDGDGRHDIGVWEPAEGNWYIRYGDGAGQFRDQTVYKWKVAAGVRQFAGDFNNDGFGDIGVWDPSAGSWRIRYGDGTGQFSRETSYTWKVASGAHPIAADFDNDGYDDIGLWETGSGKWYIRYLQGSARGFTLAQRPSPAARGTIAAITLTTGRASYREEVSGYFSHAETYTAVSGSSAIARVRVTGSLVTITPVAAGATTVTVTAANGDTASTATQTIAVTVRADSVPTESVVDDKLPDQNVVWTGRGSNYARQGMPIGNGTYSALVWAGSNRDLYLLLGANDFWDENIHLNRPGRIRIRYSGTPFDSGFRQELKLKEGEIVVTAGTNPAIETRIWADANAPVIHIESERTGGTADYTMTVSFESSRPTQTNGDQGLLNYYDIDVDRHSPYTAIKRADRTETAGNVVYWYQRNANSYFDEVLELQGLVASRHSDLLTGRTYGGRLEGEGFTASGTAVSKTGSSGRVAVTLHSEVVDSVAAWKTRLNALRVPFTTSIETQRTAHRTWWANFWNRSYIFASGDSDATNLTQKYVLTRYRQACAGRTPGMPLRFNGSIFTVGKSSDADHRPWNSYHAFNQRFAFWGMLPSGDFDLMQPNFDLYANSLQMAKDRVFAYWGPETKGAMWPEIVGLHGHVIGAEYAWSRDPTSHYWHDAPGTPDTPILSRATRHLYTSNVELVAMLLDYYEYTQDREFASTRLLPVAKEVLAFYFTRWEIAADGELHIDDAYSGEKDWNVDNPTADVSGLHKMLAGLLALPADLTAAADRTDWTTKQGQLPAIPVSGGRLNTGENLVLGQETNNQNLYPIFPMRLYGYGQPNLQVAVDSYNNRRGKFPTSGTQAWRHDAAHAAYLGLVTEAKTMVKGSLGAPTKSGWRFPTFSDGNPDGDPSVERSAIGKIAFQAMLLHPGAGNRVNLLNAWPSSWDVKFKLHAPGKVIVKGEKSQTGITYAVTPGSSSANVVVRGTLTETNATDTTTPPLSSATVTGNTLTLIYNEALDAASVPAASAFAVQAGPSGSLVAAPLAAGNAVAVAGSSVTLTLASAVAAGATVTVSYTAPDTNPVRDAAGNAAGNLTNRAVTNETGLPKVAIASTATFPTKDAFTVTLTFSKSVTGLEVGEVTVTNGTASNFSGLGTTYTVTVTPAAGYAGAVTVSVAAGAATAVGLGNAAASQTFAVDTKAPALSSATVTGSTLTLTYDEALDGTSVPASSAFAVKAGPSGSLAAALADTMPVAVAGRTVILTLAAAVSMTDVVQVSYTAPESGKLQDAVGNAAGNLTNQAVTNETPSADKLITAGDLALQIDSMGVVTGLREGSAAGTDHNVSAQSTTLVSLVVESASTARVSTGMSAHYKPTGLTYTAGTAGDGETARGVYTFSFADNISAEVTAVEKAGYATLELTGLANPNGKDVRIVRWGPLTTDITESVGEMVGVVSDRDFAIGMLGVNAKTLGGWPREYQGLSYASVAVGGNPWGSRQRAVRQGHKAARAVITTFGTALHSFTRDFTVERVIETNRIEAARAPKRRTPALTGARADAGRLVGSKVAVFGVSRADAGSGDASFREVLAAQALDRVGVIELGEGLPHPIVGNVWAKRSKKAAAPYLILTDLSTSNLDTAAAWATDIGWGTVYRDTAWGVWTDGSFGSVRSQFGGNASGLQAGIDQAERGHVDLGTHSLFGFIPPSFAGDHPTKLMVTWEADLDANITNNATSLTVRPDDGTTAAELRGGISSNDGYLRIGSEIIRYRSRSQSGNNLKLGNLQRSREGTTAAAHSAGAQVGLLRRTSYSGFNNYHAELSLYDDELIPRLVAALNRGIGDFSFDGSEWLSESKYGLLTQNLVMRKIYDDLADNEDFVHDMAMGNPYTWHLNSRYNWGETGDDIRVAHQSYRWGNQVFFKRNLMLRPRMVGWWNIDNANEWRWALGKASAFDAWFGYFGSAGDASRYNANLRAEIRDWTNAIRAGAFDWPNRFVMQERYDYFRLDKVSYSRALGPTWKLSDWATSGNSGGGRSNSRYIAPQMRGFPLTNLAPDAKVAVSGVLDNSYGGALAVDTSTGASSETNRYLTDTNGSGEWAIASSATDKWIELSWDSARKIRRIILFDREFANQNTSAGTLTFTHADSSTTTQAVTGISSDGSPKIVDFAQKTVTKVRFTLTGTSGTAPGLGEFVVLGPSSHYQSTTLAADGTVTGVTAGQAGRVNDGAIAAGSTAFATLTDNNAVLDLGGQYNIGGLNVWHRLGGASRQYHDVIFEIADNSDFDNATIVFNTDADDSLGRGAGGDAAYAEGSAGKLVQFAPVPGRYVRLWSNGNTVDSGNHLTEVEVYGTGNGTTDVADSGVTSGNNAATNLANVIDHSLDSEMANAGDGAQYVQIDLGAVKTVNSLLVMRDDANARTYKGVVYRLSETANFSSGVTTVFHNDNDNLHDLRLGESTDGEYEETENGRYVRFAPARARYVRLYSSGSDRDDSNRYREVLVGTEEAGTARPPLPVSIAVTERIVTPTAIAQTAGDTLSGYTFAVGNLIDGVGLSETPTVDNLDSVTSGTSDSHVWVTGSQASPHYFSNSNNPDPQFRLTLDGPHTLMALVVWGYQGSANEATDFTVEFSTDGGQSYVATETVQTSALLGAAGAAGAGRLEFDETHEANHVRLTITSNARVRGFSTVGGDRVGMSEIRFVATAEPTETASVAAANGSLVVLQNTAGTIDLSALAAGDMLTYAVATQPANGTVSLMGSVATYTPNTDSFGSDSFGYGVTDAESNSDTGTIAVTVNRPPAAQDGTLLTQLGVAAEIDVSLLASDLDDDTLSFRVGRQPDHGTALLRFQTGGNIVYTPEHGYTGADSFTYIAEDGAGGMDTGTITVTVSMPPPVTVTIASTATFPTKDAFTVTLTFSKSVTGLEVGEVTVTNGTASNFSGLGTTYTVTVTPAAGYAGAVTVSVAAGAATAVGLGNAAASQTFAVDTKAPALSSATVTGSTLTLTYDEALDGTSVPASSAFAVKAGPSGSLAAALADTMPVAVSGRTVILTLAAAVSMTDVVQVSYTAPESGKLQDAVGNAAGNLTNQAVTNETAGALTLRVDAVAGDDTVNIAEKAAGFSIGGTTGAAAGVAVTVVLGTQTFTAVTSAALTDHDDDTGTPEQAAWSVDVAADAAYITGASVALSVAAAKTGYTAPGPVTRTLTVDLSGPTAPSYSAPDSLKVGEAITAATPAGGADINRYTAADLPPGLAIDAASGAITGTPTATATATAAVTVTVSDTAGNPATVALTFPAVAKGDQDLSGFAYSSPSVTFGATAPTLTAPTVLESAALSYTSTAAVCTVDASSGALALVAAGACTVTVSAAATTNYNADTATFEITVNPAGALTLRVDAVAGDDTVNIAEKAAGFSIGGTTGAAAGVAVTVVLGTQTFTAVTSAALTDHDDDTGTPEQAAWSVDVAADAAYITGASVALSVAAAKTGFTAPTNVTRTLTVDLSGPTAPSYSAPDSLKVGEAITAATPAGGADINRYTAADLPPGLAIDAASGAITGTPTATTTATAAVTVTVSDTAGNPATVALTFPAVAKGDQDLSGFAYSSPSVTFGATAPTLTAPTVLESAALSYTSTAAVCTVDASSGALALVAAGACTVTVSAAATTNYNADTATFEITVNPAGALTLRVAAVAGDDTVNIAEKAAGFSIGGTTGADAGVAVTVVLGTQTFTAVTSAALTDHDDDTGTPEQAAWSVDVAADAAYITGASVALSVAAAKTGYTAPGPVTRTLTVDLSGPTAPSYSAPDSLKVGEAITAATPAGGADINRYTAADLPPGLAIDAASGAITGTPTATTTATAAVTVTVRVARRVADRHRDRGGGGGGGGGRAGNRAAGGVNGQPRRQVGGRVAVDVGAARRGRGGDGLAHLE